MTLGWPSQLCALDLTAGSSDSPSLVVGGECVAQNTCCPSTSIPPSDVATFTAGCFWGRSHKRAFLEHWPIKEDKGNLKPSLGIYTGSYRTYRQVCSGDTNRVVKALWVEFDPIGVRSLSFKSSQPLTNPLSRYYSLGIPIQHATLQPLTPKVQSTRALHTPPRHQFWHMPFLLEHHCTIYLLLNPRARGDCQRVTRLNSTIEATGFRYDA